MPSLYWLSTCPSANARFTPRTLLLMGPPVQDQFLEQRVPARFQGGNSEAENQNQSDDHAVERPSKSLRLPDPAPQAGLSADLR
jgi:hypothetical protein